MSILLRNKMIGVFANSGDDVNVKNNLRASNILLVSPSSSRTRLYPLAEAKNMTPSAESNRFNLIEKLKNPF